MTSLPGKQWKTTLQRPKRHSLLGTLNLLSCRNLYEACVLPVLLYGSEKWSLDNRSLESLEQFQANTVKRMLKLSKYHANASCQIALLLPSITVTVLLRKLKFLARLMGSQSNSLGMITFQTLASFDVYDISLVQQCLMLENQFMTNITMDCLREPNNAQQIVATSCSRLLKIDRDLAVQRAAEHPSLKFVLEVHNTTIWPS